jgi:hypothetical protein
MFDVQSATSLINIVTLVIVYLFSITIAGFVKAYVTQAMGDETAADMGFLSLNPLAHFDFIGAFLLLLFGFGWGRFIPVNPFNIHGVWRRAKLTAAYLADAGVHLTIALMSLIILVAAYGLQILIVANPMILSGYLSHASLAQLYHESSSLSITFAFLLIAMAFFNVFLGVLDLLINGFGLGMVLFALRETQGDEHDMQGRVYEMYGHYLVFIIPIVLIFFFAGPLRYLVVYMMSIVGYAVAHLTGGI